MPAKKARPKKRGMAGLPRSITAQFTDAKRIAALKRALADQQSVSKSHMRALADKAEMVGTVVHESVLQRRENQAEIDYWKAEVARLHGELIDIRRENAREQT